MRATRSRVAVIFLTVLIDLIGFGIVIPIVPYYAKRFGASGFEFGALLGVYSLMQFFAAAVLGRLSDRVGRRPVLLTTMVLNTGGYLLFAFAGSYWALFASRVIGGFAGGNISAAQAYIADSTSAADRSRGMGILGAAFGLGFVIGPAIGGAAAGLGSAAPGLVSVYASPNEQGSTLGAAQALGALGRTLGPEAIGGAYDAAGARAAFLAAAGVMALAWLATLGLEKEPSGQMLAEG